MPLVAGVDSSTQSTKVEVRDADSGELVASASAPHPATTPPRSEQDPAAWWAAFESAWAAAGSPSVAAISVAAQQHGMVALDAARQVVRPAKLWNDTESAPDAAWLWKQLDGGPPAWAAAVGSVPLAAFTIAKLSWLHRSEPEAWARLAHVVLPHDWLTAQLTGPAAELVTDRGDASGTGYWSPAAGEYRWDLLAVVDRDRDWTSVVPQVLGPIEVAGEWRGALVGPGTGDNMAAALGLGLDAGDAAISVGTSGTVYAVSPTAAADPHGDVAGFADASGRFLPLVCTLNAAKVLDAVRRLLGVDHAEFDRLALAGRSAGLVLLPYFDGERTPNLPLATGVLSGLRSDVGREQLARAAVEGVACSLLDGLDALRREASVTGRVVLTGGAARSTAVRRVLAGLCDVGVAGPAVEESVAAGACVQAAAVLEQVDPLAVAARWGLTAGAAIEPVGAGGAAEVREAYAAVRRHQHPEA
jgi:xylulokinase